MRARGTRRVVGAALVVACAGIGWLIVRSSAGSRGFAARPRSGATGAGGASNELEGRKLVESESVASASDAERADAGSGPPPSAPPTRLWSLTDGTPATMPGMLNGHVSDARRVRIEREALAELELSRRVTIELPGGQRYVALVEHMEAHDNGDRSWSGHLDTYGLRYPVIYTQGEPWTFATIVAPEGLFALEANAEDGVLYRDGREALQSSDRTCALLPD